MEISCPFVPIDADGWSENEEVCEFESSDELQLESAKHKMNAAINFLVRPLSCIWTNHANNESD